MQYGNEDSIWKNLIRTLQLAFACALHHLSYCFKKVNVWPLSGSFSPRLLNESGREYDFLPVVSSVYSDAPKGALIFPRRNLSVPSCDPGSLYMILQLRLLFLFSITFLAQSLLKSTSCGLITP